MIINNQWNDGYCRCQRCPCCGKVIRPYQLTQTWDGSGGGIALLGTSSSINDPKNAEIKSHITKLIDENKLVVS